MRNERAMSAEGSCPLCARKLYLQAQKMKDRKSTKNTQVKIGLALVVSGSFFRTMDSYESDDGGSVKPRCHPS